MIRHPDIYSRKTPSPKTPLVERSAAEHALASFGAAPEPDAAVHYSINVDGKTQRFHSNRSPDEIAEKIRQKAYLTACERALAKGEPLPPPPLFATIVESARDMSALAGRAHTDPG